MTLFWSISAGNDRSEEGFHFHCLISKDLSSRSLELLPCHQEKEQHLYATQLNDANICSNEEALQLALISEFH